MKDPRRGTERENYDMARHQGMTHSRQERFHVEEDLLCGWVDIQDSDSAGKTVYNLCVRSALAGEFQLSAEAKQEILRQARRGFELLCAGRKDRLNRQDQQVLCLACVLLVQDGPEEDEEEQHREDPRMWQTILEGLGIGEISERTGCSRETARNRLCGILDDRANLGFVSPRGHRYYNTLKLHAIAPVWSVRNLYDILYTFYHRNLDCIYEPDSDVASMFTAGIRSRWESDPTEEDQNLRASLLSSGLRDLFILRPRYMAAVCDALLERIDRIVQGDLTLLDPKNRWDALLLEWYQRKTEYEKRRMQADRSAAVRTKVVDKTEDIRPEFVFEDGSICLRIPGFRLPGIQECPVVKLYQNEQLVCQQRLSLYGSVLLWSASARTIQLNSIREIDWRRPFCFRVSIEAGQEQIYHSGTSLFRDYFCFSPAGNEVPLTRCSQMLRLIVRREERLEIEDPEEGWTEDPAPYRSIGLWPESVVSIRLNGRELLVEADGNRKRVPAYLTPEPVPGIQAEADGRAAVVYARTPTLQVILPARADAKNYQLTIDERVEQLYQYEWSEGRIRVPLPAGPWAHTLALKDFETGAIVFERSYLVLPGLSCSFDRTWYPDTVCGGMLTVQTEGESRRIPFDLLPGEDRVTWQHGGVLLETAAPRVRVEIDGKNAFALPEQVWYEPWQSAFMTVRVPENVTCSVFFGGKVLIRGTTGHYELGNQIRSRGPEEKSALLGLLIRSGELTQQRLTEVCYQERFGSDPVSLDGRKVRWNPAAAGFLGDEASAVFRVVLDDLTRGEQIVSEQGMKRRQIASIIPGKEGRYAYTVSLTKRRKGFRRLPDLELAAGEFVVEVPPEHRYDGKQINLTHVSYNDPVSDRETTRPMCKNGAVIRDIVYEGMCIHEGRSVAEYSGYLSFETASGWIEFSSSDTKRYEKVNPVFFSVLDEDTIIVRHEDDIQLMLNLKQSGVKILSKKGDLKEWEQEKYLAFGDRFRYLVEEHQKEREKI